ncbi:MAG: L-threonylcarbamoyladenylate synthase [Peptoniphilus sp.]|nr:L-threonylcarbamoyladenylate synthase [Peptoniphilus sp.]MDY6045111.1 L-threonylcarbamoyladenylate synthase [Peptoniphilus sp.]
METRVLHITDVDDREEIKEAADMLRAGELVIFPTETVYGLGADGLNEEAIDKIFAAKGRPKDNPLILHIADPEQVLDLVKVIPPKGKDCMDMFWPGPLTLIFERSEIVPDGVTAGADTVAIRMPSHPIAHAILKEAYIPVAAPSANTSGRPSPTRLSHVLEDMKGKVPIIVDSGDSNVGIESTVLDVTVDPPVIYRPGGVTKEDLEAILGEVDIDRTTIDASNPAVPKSPGQKYRHYAPKGDGTLFAGDLKNVAKEINRRLAETEPSKRTAVLCTTETKDAYEGMDLLIDMGSRENLEEVAHDLFDSLRRCDEEDIDVLFVEGFDFRGLGVGIMNRLLKACGGKVVLGL